MDDWEQEYEMISYIGGSNMHFNRRWRGIITDTTTNMKNTYLQFKYTLVF